MSIKLRPFTVPNYVLMETPPRPRQAGFVEAPKFKLEELEPDDLSSLCDDFRREVFLKAGKLDPCRIP